MIDIETFTAQAKEWLDNNAEPRTTNDHGQREMAWGEGEFSVSVFHNLTFEEEKAVIDGAVGWTRKKAEVGYHKITWEPEYGGLGLSKAVSYTHLRAHETLRNVGWRGVHE